MFLFAYLNLNRWHVRYAHITVGWLAVLAALVAVARVRSGGRLRHRAHVACRRRGARASALVVYLSTHGFDRAVLLIPTWLLLVVWVIAAGLAVTGVVTNDIVGPALLGGLVLIVMLIGFTVMQHAFAGGVTHGIVSDVERRALALTGAGDMIWDWDVSADKVFTSPETEHAARPQARRARRPGGATGSTCCIRSTATASAPRSTACSSSGAAGSTQDFRLRAADGHYLWFALKARPVVGSDGEVVRLVGTLTDVTEFKNAEERLLHDAVHDNLTGLPNRELFLDRLEAALALRQGRHRRSARP